jgi:hypothetical protein
MATDVIKVERYPASRGFGFVSHTFANLPSPDEISQLTERRAALEAERQRRKEEQQRAEAARLQAIAEQRAAEERGAAARRQATRAQEAAQERIEEDEFAQLVAEMSALNYTRSSQVSAHIVRNKLGFQYKNISGLLEMELDGRRWNFNGGFPPKIYARLCDALGLGNQHSRAKPVAFTPYKDVIQQ